MTDAVSAYALIVETLASEVDVSHATRRGFGRNGLMIGGKMFALPIGDHLLLKLPRPRVEWMVASDDGKPFDPGHGHVMKEWVLARPTSTVPWLELAREAMAFVGSLPEKKGR